MSSTVPQQDLIIPQGTDYELTFFIDDENDVVIDPTGSTFASQCRQQKNSEEVAFAFSFTLNNDKSVTMKVAKADTTALGQEYSNPLYYDVEWTDANGKTKRIFEGKITLTPEVTR